MAAAYLNAPVREKVYFRCNAEFGNLAGRYAIVTKALYVLKTSAAACCNHLAHVLEQKMGFMPCQAGPNVWMRVGTNPMQDKYYKSILVYTDDILVILHEPKKALTQLDQHFLSGIPDNETSFQ